MRFRTLRVQRYEWAYKLTRGLPFLMWVLLAVAVGGGATLILEQGLLAGWKQAFSASWPGLLLGFAAVLLFLWVIPLHWFSPWFRSLAWRICWSAGIVYRHMVSRAAWLFLLFAVAGLSWVWKQVDKQRNCLERTAEYSGAVLLAAILLAVIFAMYQARKRIIIQPFLDFTDPGKEQGQGEAIASHLRSEIAAITGLYKVIDEMSAPETKHIVEATVTVEDVGTVLKEAIGPDSKIQFRGLAIPLQAIVSPFAWLARGPRLSGSLHKEGDELLLVAEIQGGGLSGGWRASSTDKDEEGWNPDLPGWRQRVKLPAAASSMVPHLTRQLAFRIVTDLVNLGSRRWRAVRQFTEGLRAYRDKPSTQQRMDKLLQAERAFVRALGDDDTFGQCHYNLGIVYQDIHRLDSARAAFQRALQTTPSSFAAAYAIAKDHFDHGRFEESVYWCEAAIRIDAADARGWKLKGWAIRRDEERRHGAPLPRGNEAWPRIVQARDIAAALAWRTLCRRAATPDPDRKRRWIAAAATLNSGIGHCLSGEPVRAKRRFRQALSLAPDEPVLHFEVAKTWCQAGDWEQGREDLAPLRWEELIPADQVALHLYHLSANDALRPAESWSTAGQELKSKHCCLFDLMVGLRYGEVTAERMNWLEDVEVIRNVQADLLKHRMREGKDSFIDSAEVAWYLLAGLRRRKGEEAEECATRLAALDRWLERQRAEGSVPVLSLPGLGDHLSLPPEDVPTGRRELASLRQLRLLEQAARCPLDPDWLQAQVKVRLAEELLDEKIVPVRRGPLAKAARRDILQAINFLSRSGHEYQVWKQGLYSLLAEACLTMAAALGDSTAEKTERVSMLNEAMGHAERAACREPETCRQRIALGRVHAALKDYLQAEHELTTSLQLKHTSSAAIALAQVCSDRGSCLTNNEMKKQDLGLARRTLDIALRSAEVGPDEQDVQVHGRIHFLLGSILRDPSTPLSQIDSNLVMVESGSHSDNAAFHQKIARSMGYKPIESAILLGWTYFEEDRYEMAGEMFREAVGKALSFLTPHPLAGARGRQQAGRFPADAPGEERPIGELLAEALVGRALVYAKLGTHLKLAWLLNRRALKLLRQAENRTRRRELHLRYQECRGMILSLRPQFAHRVEAQKRAATEAAVLQAGGAVYRVRVDSPHRSGTEHEI